VEVISSRNVTPRLGNIKKVLDCQDEIGRHAWPS